MSANVPSLFNSVRGRYLVATVTVALMVILVSLYSQYLFSSTMGQHERTAVQLSKASYDMETLKRPLRDLEVILYRYTIGLDETDRQVGSRHLSQLHAGIKRLTQRPWVREQDEFWRATQEFEVQLNSFGVEVLQLMEMISRVESRYPAVRLMQRHLVPLNVEFTGALELAIADAREMQNEDETQSMVLDRLLELRYLWVQKVSAFRVFIANRSGVFGAPETGMLRMMQDRNAYAEGVQQIFVDLKLLQEEEALGFEQEIALETMMQAHEEREKYIRIAEKVYNSDWWRADLAFINTVLHPMTQNLWRSLAEMEQGLAALDDQQSNALAHTTQNLVWMIGVFSVVLIALLGLTWVAFRIAVHRPIMNVAQTMVSEADNLNPEPIPVEHLEEVDHLVRAFNTMQAQVHTRQMRIESILRNAGEGIITIDEEGMVESFNLAAEHIFGYTEEEMVGQSINILMPKDIADHHDAFIKQRMLLSEDGVLNMTRELNGLRKGGLRFPLEIMVSEMQLGDHIRYIGVMRDVTQKKIREKQLRDAMAATELASEQIQEKNRELERSLSQLQATQAQLVESEKMAALGGLVAGVAHEINTPVGTGITAVSTLERQVKALQADLEQGKLTKSHMQQFMRTANEAVDIIHTNLKRAADQVQSFKHVAVDQSSDERRVFNLKSYLDEILISLRPRLKRAPQQVEVDCPENIEMDSYPGSFSQIMTNLIMNSLIHAFDESSEGVMRIECSVKGENVHIHFSDNGRGIPSEHLGRVFEPFYTTRRGQGGSGLGLHLIYNIVTRRLGGTIECDSQIGVGTDFVMLLPQNPES